MGIDYNNCGVCGEIYADCEDYGNCEGCGKHWCWRCVDDIEVFFYGDDIRCDLCFDTGTKEIGEKDLLDFALEKLKTTREDLRQELKRTRPEEFDTPQNKYECQGEKKHKCIKECETLHETCEHPTEDLSNHETSKVRGLCCRFKYPKSRTEWCEKCQMKK